MPVDVEAIAAHYAVEGALVDARPFGGGHINDSYVLTFEHGGTTRRFFLQRINAFVFRNPEHVIENTRRITAHITGKLKSQGAPDMARRVLTLIPTQAGDPCHRDDAGSCWRLYHFIENARVYQSVEHAEHAEQAARAFGTFQRLLTDLSGPRLHETIPDFHNTPERFAALERAVAADSAGRVAAARAEIEFARRHRAAAGVLIELHRRGAIPERVVHNDAKISNVLFDQASGEPLCVVDLDTVMPGLAPYDFGDMVRSMSCTAAEDETDLSKVEIDTALFEGLARGYLAATRRFLTPVEREQLVFAGKLITLEQGVRFLADFLSGDVYYKTQRPNHNLDRCRTQFKLVESIKRNEWHLRAIIDNV